jgi:hypothetical protein
MAGFLSVPYRGPAPPENPRRNREHPRTRAARRPGTPGPGPHPPPADVRRPDADGLRVGRDGRGPARVPAPRFQRQRVRRVAALGPAADAPGPGPARAGGRRPRARRLRRPARQRVLRRDADGPGRAGGPRGPRPGAGRPRRVLDGVRRLPDLRLPALRPPAPPRGRRGRGRDRRGRRRRHPRPAVLRTRQGAARVRPRRARGRPAAGVPDVRGLHRERPAGPGRAGRRRARLTHRPGGHRGPDARVQPVTGDHATAFSDPRFAQEIAAFLQP